MLDGVKHYCTYGGTMVILLVGGGLEFHSTYEETAARKKVFFVHTVPLW